MEPPVSRDRPAKQHHGRTRKNSGQLTVADAGVQKYPPFQRRPYVEAAVAHCVVNTARVAKCVAEGVPPLCWVFQLRGPSQRNAEWTCGRAVQLMPSLQTALL